MAYDPRIHHRRSIRLAGYDYRQAGAYFVTICTRRRKCFFGRIRDGRMVLTAAGRMVQQAWDEIPIYYPPIEIDEFIIMPNHIHGIVVIPDTGQPLGVAPTELSTELSRRESLSLPDVVHRFKSITTMRYIRGVNKNGWPRFPGKLWQRNYWEHIIRNDAALNHIRKYIRNNPAKWNT